MKTDELFHEYFQLVPQALFELLGIQPACSYHFSSPVVKASQRRLDGLLEPVIPGHIRYFLEIQGYLDLSIYWRGVQQVGLFYEQRPQLNGSDWQLIILFLDKAFDPGPQTLGPRFQGDKPWLVTGVLSELLERTVSPSPVLNVLKRLLLKMKQ